MWYAPTCGSDSFICGKCSKRNFVTSEFGAKKIEDVYKIKILKKSDEIEARVQNNKYMKKSNVKSLGDIAFIKKKKD